MHALRFLRQLAIVATCATLAACGSSGGSNDSLDGRGPGASNAPPTIAGSPPPVAKVGQAYSFEPQAYDPDGDTLTFAILNRPEWATFSPITGRFSGTPTPGAKAEYPNIQISVTDGSETVSLPAFKLSVDTGSTTPPNGAPTIGGTPATSVVAGNAYAFAPTASDPDGQTLTFSIANRPSWAQFDSVTGRLTGTPTASHVGTYTGVTISVTDGTTQVSLPAFTITVASGAAPGPGNQAPTISGTPSQAVTVGQPYLFRPTAADPDGQSLTFSTSYTPVWATFNPATGELSGTPGTMAVGQTPEIVITVSDGQASASLPAFRITVLAANRAPTISGNPPATATVGAAYTFTPTASDPDGQTLSYSIVNRPDWATFSSTTGRLSGTPGSSHVGTTSNIVITVSDGAASASLPAFSITVAAANRAPTISGTPQTSVTVGQPYGFTPTATDPDSGQTLTFSISNRPSWAAFNSSTGRLSGTPAAADVGTYGNIVISVSDGTASATLPAFSITVADVQTGSATLRWTAPTLNEDGTPLTNLRGYRVYYGTSSSNLSQMVEIANATVTTAVVENLSAATWYFAVRAYNTSNVESSLSNVASKTIR